jgi:hypothetical protein
MTQYHVFGDTGGHYRQLKSGLEAIGYDPINHKLPDEVVVVHCGDLLHKGPSSAAVIFIVDRIMENNPGQWIQLLGNHEYQYLGGIPFWKEFIDPDAITILQSWYSEDKAQNAFVIEQPATFHNLVISQRGYETPEKPIILTHAGITRQYWTKFLKSETDAATIVNTLNNFTSKQIGAPGAIIGSSNTVEYPAGPVWALGVEEVWQSWKDEAIMPFIQIHGHTTPYSHKFGRWWSRDKDFKAASKVNPARRTVVTKISDSMQVFIDPGYDTQAFPEPQPALLITTD